MWPKPHSDKECVRPFQMLASIHHTQDCLPGPVLVGVLLNGSILLAVLLLVLPGFCSEWAIPQHFCWGSPHQRNPLACLCPHMDCQCSSCFPLVQSLITSVATFAGIPIRGSGLMIGCEEPSLGNWSTISFPSMPMCPCTQINWILLHSASFTEDWWQSQTTLDSQIMNCAFMLHKWHTKWSLIYVQ